MKRSDTGYQSQEAHLAKNDELTKSLHRAQTIICTHEVIQDHTSAQLIVQNAHLMKLNQALHTKENKTSDRTILFADGFGRHLTSDESISLIQGQKERREKEAVEKAQRLEGREACKAAKAAAEEGWAVIITAHDQAVKDWMAECERLWAKKVRAKDLPPKPKWPLKPKPVLEVVPEEGSDHGDEEEESRD